MAVNRNLDANLNEMNVFFQIKIYAYSRNSGNEIKMVWRLDFRLDDLETICQYVASFGFLTKCLGFFFTKYELTIIPIVRPYWYR